MLLWRRTHCWRRNFRTVAAVATGVPLQRSSHRCRYLNEHDLDSLPAVAELTETKKKKACTWVESTWSTRRISSLFFLLVVAETHVFRGESTYRTPSALETPPETPLDGAPGGW